MESESSYRSSSTGYGSSRYGSSRHGSSRHGSSRPHRPPRIGDSRSHHSIYDYGSRGGGGSRVGQIGPPGVPAGWVLGPGVPYVSQYGSHQPAFHGSAMPNDWTRVPSIAGARTPSHHGSRVPSHHGSRAPSHHGSIHPPPSHHGSWAPSHHGSHHASARGPGSHRSGAPPDPHLSGMHGRGRRGHRQGGGRGHLPVIPERSRRSNW